MNISKYITILFLPLLLFSFCTAQEDALRQLQEAQMNRQHLAQRKNIDSLQKIMQTASDTVKINCLNALSIAYYIYNTDTARNYATKAYQLATAIHYTKGMADGLLNLAQIKQERGDINGAEQYFRQACGLYGQADNANEYNEAVARLGYNLMLQLRFEEARSLKEKNLLYYSSRYDSANMVYTYRDIGTTYDEQGYYEKAFGYYYKDMLISRDIQEYKGLRRDLYMWGNYYLAGLYKDAGDDKTALMYFRLSAEKAKEYELPDVYNSRMGDIYVLQHQYDTARYYYRMAYHFTAMRLVDTPIQKYFLTDQLISIGETFLKQQQYDSALAYLVKPLQFCFPANFFSLPVLYDAALACQGKKQFAASFQYTGQLLDIARKSGARQDVCNALEMYWKLYEQTGNKDSAYKYHLLFSSLKDTLANDKQLRNIAVQEMKTENQLQESKITLLAKEKKIQQQQKLLLLLLLFGLGAIMFILFRYHLLKQHNEAGKRRQAENELSLQKLEAQRTKAAFEQKATVLEMQALRAQMNPHFIFNSLNAINRFILKNDKAQASEFLTKFSRLIRLILQNSQSAFIPLEKELESLQLYLELEALRFEHHFEFIINVDDTLETDIIKVPPLIIQPYVENAIWHGLMHKEEKGQLEIALFQQQNMLCCRIADNGIGRNKAKELRSKSAAAYKSMGMQITASRIEMLQQKELTDTHIQVNDLVLPDGSAGGTEVILKIPTAHD
ncbi:MAG: histidine kinase [Chitinophagaceae bacterium]